MDRGRIKATVERSERAMVRGDWSRAITLWRQVLDEFGDHAPRKVHLRLAQAMRRGGDVAGAQAVLMDRLERDPNASSARVELARMAASQADWERAAILWGEALDSTPAAAPEVVNGLVEALCHLGRFREADEALQRASLAGRIHRHDVRPVFDSEILRAQYLGRFGGTSSATQGQAFEDDNLEWWSMAVGAQRLGDAAEVNALVDSPSAIWISAARGWGNAVLQLATGLEIAQILDVPRVYTPRAWYLQRHDPIRIRDRQLIQADGPSPGEALVLRGRFLLLRALGDLVSGSENPYGGLVALRPFTCLGDREPLDEDDLVIHLRAGDVFRKERVNPRYGQPPLAYYLLVLRQQRWRSVHLVYEDDGNPVIERLLAHLRLQGMRVTTVVADLRSTIEFLLSARTIVAGRGTFIPAIAGLSSNLRRLYTFEGALTPGFERWEELPTEQIDVIDDVGSYRRAVMSSNWKHRPDQVELMLRYPESALRLAPSSGAGATVDTCF